MMGKAVLFALLLIAACADATLPYEEVGFGLMIDAGSTGTRVHTYRWLTTPGTALPEFTDDFFKEVSPGLSSFHKNPNEAGKSIIPLLEDAKSHMPESYWSTAMVTVKATAGLRLLGDEVQEAILDSVFNTLKQYPFQCDRGRVSVISGVEEAVGAWLTVNYLLDTLTGPQDSTVGILDLGGASTQVACVPVSAQGRSEHVTLVTLGHVTTPVFVISHLKYGLMEARKRLDRTVLERGSAVGEVVANPCFPKGWNGTGSGQAGADGMSFRGTGDFAECQQIMSEVMQPARELRTPSCNGRFLAMSYYYDVLPSVGLGPVVGVRDVERKASEICRLSYGELQSTVKDARPGFVARACGDLLYIAALLQGPVALSPMLAEDRDRSEEYQTNAGDFAPNVVRLGKKISGKELSWTMGSTLLMMQEQEAPPPELMSRIWWFWIDLWYSLPEEARFVGMVSAMSMVFGIGCVSVFLWISVASARPKVD